MPIDPVPWAVGGAEHSVDLARQVAYNAANGNEGVVGGGDCEVRALDVAGTAVRILPGAFNVLNRVPGYSSQMYMGRFTGETTLDVASTGSGNGRSDLVVAEIMDPNLSGSGYQPPDDPLHGPYVRERVISGVDPDTETVAELGQGLNAIPLARLDIPASTGAITQAMITDLRTVANPHSLRRPYTYAMGQDNEELQTALAPTGEYFPNVARWDIRIPDWATAVNVLGALIAARAPDYQVYGRMWVGIGDVAQTTPDQIRTQDVRYDTTNNVGVNRVNVEVADTVRIPASMRGRLCRFGLRAYKEYPVNDGTGTKNNRLMMDGASAVKLDIEFVETPSTNQAGV